MRATKQAGLAMAVSLLMLFAACAGEAEPGGQELPEAPTTEGAEPTTSVPASTESTEEGVELPDEIVIGIPASLTGQYEALGRQGLDGLNMFAEWVNNERGGIDVGGTKIPVRIVFGDDRSDKDTALRLFEKLVLEDGAHFMFASYSSGLTLSQAPLADQLDVVSMAWGASSDDIWEQGFTRTVGVYTPASQYDHSLLDFVTAADPAAQTVAIAYKDDPFTVAEAEGAQAKAEELGMEVVYFDKYPAEAADLSPILTQAADSDPDVILVVAHFQDGALAARQMQELGIDPMASSFGSGAATTDWWTELGEAAQGTFGPAQWEPSQTVDPAAFDTDGWVGPQVTPAEFSEQYSAEFGYEPDYRGGLAFHAGLALMAAIEAAGSVDTQAVIDAFKELDIQTMGGGFRVDPETLNQVGHSMLTIQWQDGEKVIIAPAESATGEAIYPANE
ncbi:MAG: amino acid ABC transporter substrate-binding protein [Acidimicrobiia bacterium]